MRDLPSVVRTDRRLLRRYHFIYIFLIALSGFAISIAYFKYFIAYQIANISARIAILTLLIIVSGVLTHALVQHIIALLRFWSRRAISIWACAATIVVVFLVVSQSQPTLHHLEITATAQKGPFSYGTEVWVLGFTRADGSRIAPTEYVLDGNWQIQGSTIIAHPADKPLHLTWQGVLEDDAHLQLLKHPWSGIAEVRWDDKVQTFDLYAIPTGGQLVTLANNSATDANSNTFKSSFYTIVNSYSLALLLFALGIVVAGWIYKPPLPNTPLLFQKQLFTVIFFIIGIIPLVWLIAPAIASNPPHNVDYVAIYLYCLLALLTCICLFRLRDDAVLHSLQRLSRPFPWFKQVVWQRARITWLFGLVGAGFVAFLIIYQVQQSAQDPYAVWARLLVDSANEPPLVSVRYTDSADDQTQVIWQPYANTTLAIRRTDNQQDPLRIQAIDTDQGPLAFNNVHTEGASIDQNGLFIPDPRGAYLHWDNPTRAFTMTLASGTGNVEAFWYDQHIRVALGPNPSTLAFHLPAAYQGWVLIPARAMDQLHLTLSPPPQQPASAGSSPTSYTYRFRSVSLLQTAGQEWSGDQSTEQWAVEGCTFDKPTATLVINQQEVCSIQLPNVHSLRVVYWQNPFLAWALLTLLLFGVLLLFTLILARLQHGALSDKTVQYQREQLLPQEQHFTPRKAMWLVLGIGVVFHFCYIITIPIYVAYDSFEYYQFAQDLFQSLSVVVHQRRTPGYPLLLGIIRTLCGDNALWIIAAQHSALILLGVLTVWSLVKRVPLKLATWIGVLVGVAPVMSILANTVLTETFFTVCATAALLVYLRCGTQPRGMLVVGMLLGVAAMIRPTAIVLVVVLLVWVCLLAWSYRSELQRWSTWFGLAMLLVGYITMVTPWYMHLTLLRGRLDATTIGSWTAAVDQSWLAAVNQRIVTDDLPSNRPERASWAIPLWWEHDGYKIISRSPLILASTVTQTSGRFSNYTANDTYLAAGLQEGRKENQDRYLEAIRSSLVYGLFFKWTGDDTYIHFTDIADYIKMWRSPFDPPPAITDESQIDQRLSIMAYHWQPQVSPMRNTLLAISAFPIDHWDILAVLALMMLGIIVWYAELRVFIPFYLYWFGLILAYAIIGLPSDRYIAVCEPLLYIVVGVGLYTFIYVVIPNVVRSTPVDDAATA